MPKKRQFFKNFGAFGAEIFGVEAPPLGAGPPQNTSGWDPPLLVGTSAFLLPVPRPFFLRGGVSEMVLTGGRRGGCTPKVGKR